MNALQARVISASKLWWWNQTENAKALKRDVRALIEAERKAPPVEWQDVYEDLYDRIADYGVPSKYASEIARRGADEWKNQNGKLTTNTSPNTAASRERGTSKSVSNVVPIGSPHASTDECPLIPKQARLWNVPGC